MDIEDILTGLVAILFAVISIFSRSNRAKRGRVQQEESMAGESSTHETTREWKEPSIQPYSSEQIIDEVGTAKIPYKAANKVSATKDRNIKNATNRTFSKGNKEIEKVSKPENKKSKFNLREAVIYSEILTPKFKDGE